MTDEELNLALAEALTANTTAPEENIVVAPEVPETPDVTMSAAMVTIECPESASAIEAVVDEPELVLQEVEPEVAQPDPGDFDIIEEPAPNAGFVKRWARKIVGWVKRVFRWGKK